ncbi:MAG: FAD-binding protein [Betaproteobacteria bacterium]|nr:FAD-binding protein [Betaproteobacteria bacterium]
MALPQCLAADVLVIGSGGAGMYAAIEAARQGCSVILADRSLIGRGGATVMAQMTVAVALDEGGLDHPEHHYADTLSAGRGLCDPAIARLLCEEGPARIREMDGWGVGWARENGEFKRAFAPGHDRARCVYVDFLNTGPAVSKTLRAQLNRIPEIRRVGDLLVSALALRDGECVGATALHLSGGQPVSIAADATVLATGGLTRMYRRNSASANMMGDGYALALAAGAELIDMEFVQFFPIGHLAPRLVGMDPIMWDPFRYKLGGRLLNGRREEFIHRYGSKDDGRYVVTRDVATYAIIKEAEAGRGSPHGGAWLSFEHCSQAELRAAGGPVIDRLAANGIDLTKQAIEVAPIAHYHMGGVRVDATMATRVPGLYAAGEAVGGANGANRLSGNAITEALVFGRVAGKSAAGHARRKVSKVDASVFAKEEHRLAEGRAAPDFNPAAMVEELQSVMQDDVGPFRTQAGLERALGRLRALRAELPSVKPAAGEAYDTALADWLDLCTLTRVGECVAAAALARSESRGAHQREDFPGMDPQWAFNQALSLAGGELRIESSAVPA